MHRNLRDKGKEKCSSFQLDHKSEQRAVQMTAFTNSWHVTHMYVGEGGHWYERAFESASHPPENDGSYDTLIVKENN